MYEYVPIDTLLELWEQGGEEFPCDGDTQFCVWLMIV